MLRTTRLSRFDKRYRDPLGGSSGTAKEHPLPTVGRASNEEGISYTNQDDTLCEIRSGGIRDTTLNDTGQRRDGTGMLSGHARPLPMTRRGASIPRQPRV